MLNTTSFGFKNLALSIGILGSVFLVGCGNSGQQNKESKAETSQTTAAELPKEVRLAWGGGPRVWVLGKANGDFENALGTKVKWIEFATGADVINYFAANEIDIARFGSSPAVAGITRGLPIEIIGLEGLISSAERLIARPDIKNLQGLVGKKVAFPANSTAQYALEQALALEKIDKSKIQLIALKPAEIVSAWTRGDIDAAYVWGPFTQQLEKEGGKEIFSTTQLNNQGILVYNNFAVRKEFAEKYPELVVKFLKTYQKQVDEYQKNPKEASEKISKYLSLPYDQVETTLAGIEYIPLKEQISQKYLGATPDDETSGIAKATLDISKFLVTIGELKQSDVPKSYAPNINSKYLIEATK
ncbi:taurine ABC transporter substrate-binding protein [Acinetobacter sp. ANC 4558]|uniref:taurine ABC transporter substrate-binding protein n=1 Tax=Acinetobacter sp. ANC 4558 TaxID=1977876 RepID=UPI000A34D2B5|nr:ABC transporter substrate-binding protein [Acinetobacter sp. ANC 4558]OTG86734.1 taurine ABC transporter substrate-binding protein [Acinetobacter sp. ANC 4558]